MKIYLDNSATTQVDKEVVKAMMPYFSEKFGNPNSLHEFGRDAREAVENARKKIAEMINCEPEEIIFTSGGTESNNLAIKGLIGEKKHIITSKIEHPSVLETCRELEKQGYKVDYISVDKEGIINIQELKRKISNNTLLVSIMHVNNEIGTIQPLEEIGKICREFGVLFHTDAVQSFGKIKIDVKNINIDLLSASGHKINAPKGVGFLYVKKEIKIKPLVNGGGHEKNLRSGTENVPGIVGFGKACEIADKKMKEKEKIKKLRDKLIQELEKIPGTRLNGSRNLRIFNNVNVSFSGIEGEALVLMLDKEGIATSTGSACSSHSLEPSHVLKAIGLSDLEAHGSLRLSLGWENNEKEINFVIDKIRECVDKLRKISKNIEV
ncbi:cysteine desulfurase NifS [Candidatus Pacearchaeota archaeon]|nr:cysteine desulfurase NifS [Candidatus Pacearchaeota archaeon]